MLQEFFYIRPGFSDLFVFGAHDFGVKHIDDILSMGSGLWIV